MDMMSWHIYTCTLPRCVPVCARRIKMQLGTLMFGDKADLASE
jgi:hypothetical protein